MENNTGAGSVFIKFWKGFLKWFLRPVLILSASLVLVGMIWNYYKDYRDRDLAVAKVWPVEHIPFNQGQATLVTSWRESKLYYQFFVTPISEEMLSRYRSRRVSSDRAFFLDFEDGVGFKLGTIDIDLNQMNRIVDEKGRVDSLALKDSAYFARDSYRNAVRVTVGWSRVFDEIAKEIASTRQPARATKERTEDDFVPLSALPFFTIGSSKDDVLRVQGQPTSVSTNMWWYGTSYVFFDSGGRVERWSGSGLKARIVKAR